MKKLLRIMSIMLALVVILSLLVSCKSDKKELGTTTTEQKSTTSDESYDEIEEEDQGPSWSWDTTPWEINNWYVGFTIFNTDYDPVNNMGHKIIYEKTGLEKVEFSVPATEANEKLNAMIAAKTYPDIITIVNENNQQLIKLLQDGGLVDPLVELMEDHAPTFKKEIMETSKAMVDWWKSDDGKLYGFPNNTETGRRHPQQREPLEVFSQVMYARRDLMEEYGIQPEDFTTQDGMVEALKKIKDSAITQDGLSIWPMLVKNINKPYDGFEFHAQMFGISNEDPETGDYVQGINDPKFYEFVKFFNRLYRENLYTDENIIINPAGVRELVSSNRIFMYYGHSIAHAQAMAANRNTNGEIYYVPVGPVRSNEGNDPAFRDRGVSKGWTVTFITKEAKNKDRIIRLFEYLWSEEGQILNKFGIEGVTYTKDENGIIQMMESYENEAAADADKAKRKYGIGTMWMFSDDLYTESVRKEIPYEEMADDQQMGWNIRKHFGRYFYDNDINQHIMVDPTPGTEEAEIKARINVYLDEQVVKMITAKTDEDFERIFDESVREAEKLGLRQLWEVQNKKFWELKNRMEIEYVFPEYR